MKVSVQYPFIVVRLSLRELSDICEGVRWGIAHFTSFVPLKHVIKDLPWTKTCIELMDQQPALISLYNHIKLSGGIRISHQED